MANAVAIVIAVVLAPVLTTSQATVGVPQEPASKPVTVTATPAAAVVPPASVARPQNERFSTQAPQDVPDRNGQRQSVDDDHDDTLAAPPPGASVESNGSDFVSPVPGPITGAFGQRFHPILHYWRMHNGVDMTAACGTVVIAAYKGTVSFAGVNGGYGNLVVINHGQYNGKHVISKYAHLSRIGVRVGDTVETGQGIALSGTTGLSTGCHLHFEIQENGRYVDPAPYLTGKPSPRPDGPIESLGPSTSPSPTASAPSSPAPTRPATPSPTKSASPSPKPSKTPTPSRTPTPTPSKTPSPTESATPTPSPSTSEKPTPTPSPSTSEKPTPTPTPSASEEPTPTPEPSESKRTPEPEPSETKRATPSPSETEKARPSASPTPSAKEEDTPSPSAEATP